MRYLTDLDFIDSVNRMRIDQQITLLRKVGRADKAHALAKKHYVVGGDNSRMLTSAYGWALHARISRSADYSDDSVTMDDYRQWLDEFKMLFPEVEDNEINAYLLRVAIRQCYSADWFLDFLRWFGLERLTDKDNMPYITAHKKAYFSTSEQYFNAVAYQLAHVQQQPSADLLDWADMMFDLGLKKFPDSEHLHYFKALRLIQADKEKAGIDWFSSIAAQKADRYWVRIQMGYLLLLAEEVEAAKSQFEQAMAMLMLIEQSRSKTYFFNPHILLDKLRLNYPIKILGEMLIYKHYYAGRLSFSNAAPDYLFDTMFTWFTENEDRLNAKMGSIGLEDMDDH